jgi:nucleotide-binding universal stress UspA family protein
MEDKLVVIATENYASAQILQTYLESNGIEAYLHNENLVQPMVSEGVQVQIKESDVEKAVKLLTEKHPKEHPANQHSPRKILVPIDFSRPSQNAARFALHLASMYGSEIKLLHVFNSPMVDMIPFTDAASIQIDIDISYNILRKNAKERLLKFYEDLKLFAKNLNLEHIKIGYSLVEGYAAYGIIEMSQRYKPGIIVMGTKGEGYRSTELVGSVATEVSDETRLPLLIIPEAAVLKGVDEVKNVLYATNFDACDFIAIRKLISITSSFNVNIYCLHVSDEPDIALQKAKMNSIKEYFNEVSPKIKVECEIIQGKDIVKTFKNYIADKNINLVALTVLKRNLIYKIFNPSITKKMLYQSDIPVLLFHS